VSKPCLSEDVGEDWGEGERRRESEVVEGVVEVECDDGSIG